MVWLSFTAPQRRPKGAPWPIGLAVMVSPSSCLDDALVAYRMGARSVRLSFLERVSILSRRVEFAWTWDGSVRYLQPSRSS